MKIKVLKPLHVNGKTVKAGDRVYNLEDLELDEKRAKILIEAKVIKQITITTKGDKNVNKKQ